MHVILHIKDNLGNITPRGDKVICYLGAVIRWVKEEENIPENAFLVKEEERVVEIEVRCSKDEVMRRVFVPSDFSGEIFFNHQWIPYAKKPDGTELSYHLEIETQKWVPEITGSAHNSRRI